jgi:hypothetical protein
MITKIIEFSSLVSDLAIAMSLVPLSVLPRSIRYRLLTRHASFFSPIISRLLFPAYRQETHRKPLWKNPPIHGNHEEIIFVFGGNHIRLADFDTLFQGTPLGPGQYYPSLSHPLLMFPVTLAESEEAYIKKIQEWILEYTQNIDCNNVRHLYGLGHSLGGAILIQITPFLLKTFPHAQITLSLDRTFSALNTVVRGLHPWGGKILEQTLGLIWKFESYKHLQALEVEFRCLVRIYQIEPDYILGKSMLYPSGQSLARKDWSSKIVLISPQNNLHSAPFEQCFKMLNM